VAGLPHLCAPAAPNRDKAAPEGLAYDEMLRCGDESKDDFGTTRFVPDAVQLNDSCFPVGP